MSGFGATLRGGTGFGRFGSVERSLVRPGLICLRALMRHLLPLIALCGLTASCAGWQQADTYVARDKDREATYRFGTPGEAWRPLRDKGFKHLQVAWIEPSLAGVIELHSQCDEQGDSALHQYTDHLRIDWTDWKVVETKEETLAGRAALRTRVTGKLDGVPRASEFVVLKKNGCLFDLRYSTRPEAFERGRADFEQVVEGFRFPVRQ